MSRSLLPMLLFHEVCHSSKIYLLKIHQAKQTVAEQLKLIESKPRDKERKLLFENALKELNKCKSSEDLRRVSGALKADFPDIAALSEITMDHLDIDHMAKAMFPADAPVAYPVAITIGSKGCWQLPATLWQYSYVWS